MKTVSSIVKKIILALVVVGIVVVVVEFYSYIFSRTVVGRIDNVARVTGVTAMFGNRQLTDGQLHMFSVSIRQPNGEMVTAISEDAQWAIARAGLCVKANYYPYPPWNLKQAGTYFNARLLTMVDCGSQAARELGIDPASFENVPIPSGAGPETPADVPHDLPASPPSMEQGQPGK
jgi:hypothetical protein